jgi:tetratricopeptide (TPR) repeat protein
MRWKLHCKCAFQDLAIKKMTLCGTVPSRPSRWVIPVFLIPAALWSDDLNVRLARGLSAMRSKNCEAALADLRVVASANSQNVQAHTAIGICETELGHLDRAVASFQQVVRLQPRSWEAWNNLGGSLILAEQPQRALVAFQKATALNPRSDSAWFNLGSTLLKLERNPEAFRSLDHASRLAPKDAGISKARLDAASRIQGQAASLVKTGRYQEAKDLLLLVQPPLENSGSWNNLLGYSEFKLGQYEPALNHLQKALTLAPSNEDFVLDIGEFLVHYQARDASMRIFEIAAKKFPSSKRVQLMLAVIYILGDQRPEAVALLNNLMDRHPDYEPIYAALGECYEKSREWESLVSLGQKLHSEKADTALGWYLEGVGLLNLGIENRNSIAPAVAALKKAVQVDPGSSRHHFALAKAHQWEKDYDLAVVELEQTTRLDPLHESAHYSLGLLYQRAGKKELANREFEIHKNIKERDRAIKLLVQARPR